MGEEIDKKTLKINHTGEAVRALSRLLVERGHLKEPSNIFDRTLKHAVEEFQARHVDERGRPLVVDGIVGPMTWWALKHPDNANVLRQPVADPLTRMPPMGGSLRGRLALEIALSEMASGAKEEVTNNSGPWVEKYLNGIVDPPANWCAAFVSWCFSRHREGLPFRYSLGARDIRTQFKQKKWTYEVSQGTLPEPGDIIVWWRGQPDGWKGHIGLVHSLSEGGILYTVEGNKGGFPAPVRVFDYVLSRMDRLLGFGRVPM
jgi:hypothetical protein